MWKKALKGLPVLLAVIAICHLVFYQMRFITSPELVQVMYVPDDAYYYLTLAKNFVLYHHWTFDGGVSVTSGFHLLWAYILAGIYAVFRPDTEAFVRIAIALSSLLAVASATLLWIIGKVQDRTRAYLFALVLLTGNAHYPRISVAAMEWGVALFFSALYILVFNLSLPAKKAERVLFLVGLLGSLARSDFGLLPFAFLVSVYGVAFFSREGSPRAALRKAAIGLAGAIVGLLTVFIHSYLVTGTFLQTSVLVKLHWRHFPRGNPVKYVLKLTLEAMGITVGGRWVFYLAGVVGLLLFIALAKKITSSQDSFSKRVTFLAANLSVLGFIFLYSRAPTVPPWYTSNLIAPLFVALVASLQLFCAESVDAMHTVWRKLAAIACVSVVSVLVVYNLSILYPIGVERAPWPHQASMLKAGRYLAAHPLDGRVGAWNAGIIGYYQGGQVVNLDGLVNGGIYRYIVENRVPDYLRRYNVRYIIDFKNMFTPYKIRRGGYSDPAFLKSLRPIKVFDKGSSYTWRGLTLYEIVSSPSLGSKQGR